MPNNMPAMQPVRMYWKDQDHIKKIRYVDANCVTNAANAQFSRAEVGYEEGVDWGPTGVGITTFK